MVHWQLYDDETCPHGWDENILRFDHYNVYQSHAWGEFKCASGWTPHRVMGLDERGNPLGMVQVLLKRAPLKVGILWAPGGPLGDLALYDDHFVNYLKGVFHLRWLYVRVSPCWEAHGDLAAVMVQNHWARSAGQLRSSQTMVINPSVGEEGLRYRMSKNWRHNLQRSCKYPHRVSLWCAPDIDEVFRLYRDMEQRKKLAATFTRDEMEALGQYFGKNLILLQCRDNNGALLGLRACVFVGEKALDIWAAVNEQGRRVYASYLLFWEMMNQCRENKITHYDLAGIDPQNNVGVYNFKKGTGAAAVDFLGEWERCDAVLLQTMINLKVKMSSH